MIIKWTVWRLSQAQTSSDIPHKHVQVRKFFKQRADRSILTELAGEGGPDLAPQKFLSSQKFRHLMG